MMHLTSYFPVSTSFKLASTSFHHCSYVCTKEHDGIYIVIFHSGSFAAYETLAGIFVKNLLIDDSQADPKCF